MTTPDVGGLIERARVAARLSQRGLAEATGISQSTLSRIISGDRVAKLPEIVLIAQATGHTVAQLTGAGTVADRVQCAARATNDSGMEGMRETLLHFLELNDYLDDQAIPTTGQSPPRSESRGPNTVHPEAEGCAAAERFRQESRLGEQPLGDLVAVIEQATGIDVAVLNVGPDEHGLTMRDPRRAAVFIGVARTRNPMRQRSTLAHELGHVLFGDWADSGKDNWSAQTPEENRCRAFARHLLVPIEGLRAFLGDREEVTLAALSAVVQRFLVSPAIAVIALEQAGYIDTATRQEWGELHTPELAIRFGWSDQCHALQAESDQRRAPQGLLARAIMGYAEGVLPVQAIATLRGVSAQEIEAELREVGIEPVEQGVAWAHASELPYVDVDLATLEKDLNASDDGTQVAAMAGKEVG